MCKNEKLGETGLLLIHIFVFELSPMKFAFHQSQPNYGTLSQYVCLL